MIPPLPTRWEDKPVLEAAPGVDPSAQAMAIRSTKPRSRAPYRASLTASTWQGMSGTRLSLTRSMMPSQDIYQARIARAVRWYSEQWNSGSCLPMNRPMNLASTWRWRMNTVIPSKIRSSNERPSCSPWSSRPGTVPRWSSTKRTASYTTCFAENTAWKSSPRFKEAKASRPRRRISSESGSWRSSVKSWSAWNSMFTPPWPSCWRIKISSAYGRSWGRLTTTITNYFTRMKQL